MESKLEQRGEAMSVGSDSKTMLELNGLKYRIPQPLSTGVSRTYKREYAVRQSYEVGAPILFNWNTGTSYVEPQSAILSFDLVLKQSSGFDRNYTWGTGLGACNLIEEIRIITRSGVEIDRTTGANMLAKVRSDYTMSPAARACLAMLDGAPAGGIFALPNNVEKTLRISIPLKFLSGFFRPTVEGMLIPAGLASGLKFEFMLASANRAFTNSAGLVVPLDAGYYKVTNAEMLLQCTELNDPVQAALMKDSALSGLEYTFPSYFTTVVGNKNSTQITEQINKAVSQGTRVFTAIVDKDGDNVDSIAKDGFASINSDRIAAYQFRLASMYFPQSVVTRPSEYWALANATFDELRKLEYQPNQVTYNAFNTGGKLLLGTSLETSDRLNLAGLPINNSSVCELRLQLQDGTNSQGPTTATDAVDAYIFLEYISVTKTNVNRTTLRI
jgi:hypothetical protein